MVNTQAFPSRDCFKHALVVNTQAFPSRDCFKHALVVNTQAFPSRDCFKHALVVNAQAFPSQDCFKHALVASAQAFSSREWFKLVLVVNTSFSISTVFQARACGECIQACACCNLMTCKSTASLSQAVCGTPVTAINNNKAQPNQLIVQAVPQAQREKVGRLWAQSVEVYIVKELCLGLPLSKPRRKFEKVNSFGNAEAHITCKSRQPFVICFIGVWTRQP